MEWSHPPPGCITPTALAAWGLWEGPAFHCASLPLPSHASQKSVAGPCTCSVWEASGGDTFNAVRVQVLQSLCIITWEREIRDRELVDKTQSYAPVGFLTVKSVVTLNSRNIACHSSPKWKAKTKTRYQTRKKNWQNYWRILQSQSNSLNLKLLSRDMIAGICAYMSQIKVTS